MQSKTSFFNKTIYSKTVMRYWPVWGIMCLLGAIAPLFLLVEAIDSNDFIVTTFEVEEFYYMLAARVVPIISFGYAIIAAMMVWDYLYSNRSVVFYHSLPVTREGLFVSNYLAGLTMMLIPYATTAVLVSIEFACWGGFSLKATLLTIWAVIVQSLLYFSMATLFAHLTGFLLALPALYLVFNFVFPAVEYVIQYILSQLLFGIGTGYSGILKFLSPLIYSYEKLYLSYDREEQYIETDGAYTYINKAVHFMGGNVLICFALIGITLTVIAYLLYKNRKSEYAGSVITITAVKNVIHGFLAAISGVVGGLILALIFSQEEDPAGLCICSIVAGTVAFYVGKMLIERTAKVFNKKNFIGCVCCALVYIVLCIIVAKDAFGVERFVPKAESIDQVEITVNGNRMVLDADRDISAVDDLLKFHQAMIDDVVTVKENTNTYFHSYYEDRNDFTYEYIVLTYKLKSGRKVERDYSYAFYTNNYDDDVTATFFKLVKNSELTLKLLHTDDNYSANGVFVSGDFDGQYASADYYGKDGSALYEAVVMDAKEGNWTPLLNDYYLAKEGFSSESINGHTVNYLSLSIDFTSRAVTQGSNSYLNYGDNVYVDVKPEMVHTIKALDEIGFFETKPDEPIEYYKDVVY